MEAAFEDKFVMSRNTFVILMALSVAWVSFNGSAVIPIGFLICVWYVGRNYATTFTASLVEGKRVLGFSAALAAVGWALAGYGLNISAHDGGTGFSLFFKPLRILGLF